MTAPQVLPRTTATDEPEPLTAADMRWTLDEWPIFERVDRLTLTTDEVRAYARDLQHECAWLRALLHEALTLLQRLTLQLRAARLTIRTLRREARSR